MDAAKEQHTHSRLENATTALFVPGDRPERFAKAVQSGAGIIILDLEDAVANERRAYALDCVVSAIRNGLSAVVRIVAADNLAQIEQLRALASVSPLGIMVPKSQTLDDVEKVCSVVGEHVSLIALIETALGVLNCASIAHSPRVARLAFGAFDYSLDLDADSSAILDHARASVVVASRAMGLASPLDSPTAEFRDLDVVRAAATAARRSGFGGQLCIHPAQVAIVEDAYYPTAEQISKAHEILSIADGVGAINGQMIDRPVIEKARRVISFIEARASK